VSCLFAMRGPKAENRKVPMESVHLNDDTTVSIAHYISRRQPQLITCADFLKLWEKGCSNEAQCIG